jgi:hypothetical protein
MERSFRQAYSVAGKEDALRDLLTVVNCFTIVDHNLPPDLDPVK